MQKKNVFNPIVFGIVYFVMFVVALALNKDGKVIMFPSIKPGFWQVMIIDTGIGIGIGTVVVWISQILTQKIQALQALSREFARLIGPLRLQEIFFLAFFSSVGEEFLFRGIIQGHFGLLVAAIAFGMLHTAPGKKGTAWTIFALLMGLVLGASYIWRGNILVPTWIHLVVNFGNIYLLQRSAKGEGVE